MRGELSSWFGWLTGSIMTVAVIAGLLVIGGPGKARLKKQDAARLYAMQATTESISCFREVFNKLPEDSSLIKAETEDGSSNIHQKNCNI